MKGKMKIVDLTAEHKAYAVKTSKGWARTKRYYEPDPVMFSEDTPEFLTDKAAAQLLYAQTCAMGVDGAVQKAKRPEGIKIYKFDLAVAALRISCKQLSKALEQVRQGAQADMLALAFAEAAQDKGMQTALGNLPAFVIPASILRMADPLRMASFEEAMDNDTPKHIIEVFDDYNFDDHEKMIDENPERVDSLAIKINRDETLTEHAHTFFHKNEYIHPGFMARNPELIVAGVVVKGNGRVIKTIGQTSDANPFDTVMGALQKPKI